MLTCIKQGQQIADVDWSALAVLQQEQHVSFQVRKLSTYVSCSLLQAPIQMCQLGTLAWAVAKWASCLDSTSASATNLWASLLARGAPPHVLSWNHICLHEQHVSYHFKLSGFAAMGRVPAD